MLKEKNSPSFVLLKQLFFLDATFTKFLTHFPEGGSSACKLISVCHHFHRSDRPLFVELVIKIEA